MTKIRKSKIGLDSSIKNHVIVPEMIVEYWNHHHSHPQVVKMLFHNFSESGGFAAKTLQNQDIHGFPQMWQCIRVTVVICRIMSFVSSDLSTFRSFCVNLFGIPTTQASLSALSITSRTRPTGMKIFLAWTHWFWRHFWPGNQ